MPPKRKHDPGYKLPEVIEPEENCCICIPVPNDFNHKMAFLGQLDELGYWWNWERDDEKKGREAAAVWRKIVECIREEMDMSGCGCSGEKPTNARINPETGIYEESYDGGVTWEPAPQSDPRSSGVVYPPIPGDPGDTMRCQGSNSVVAFLIEMQDVEHGQLTANATIADAIIAVLGALSAIGIFLAFVPAAVFALVAFVVGTFGHMIAGDFEAAFSEADWDALLCILYCNMEPDGSFTMAGWQAVKSDIREQIDGYSGQWIYDHINLIGVAGLTNAARASYPGSRDCETCICNECNDVTRIVAGTLLSQTSTTIEITAELTTINGTTAYWAFYGGEDDDESYCCYICGISAVDATSGGFVDCDGNVIGTLPANQLIRNVRAYKLGAPFVLGINFDPGCV